MSGGFEIDVNARYDLSALTVMRGPAAPAASVRKFDWTLGEAALEALVSLIPNPVGVSRDVWIAVLHGVAGAGGAFEVWERWSAKWPGYDAGDTRRAWDTLDVSGVKSGGGNLRAMAEAADRSGFEAWKQKWEPRQVFDDGEAGAGSVAAAKTMHALDDFRSVTHEQDFIHIGTGKFWRAPSVDAVLGPVTVGVKADGSPKTIKATAWMRAHSYVTELSWIPGRERIIANHSVGVDGIEVRPVHSIFNLYTAPAVVPVVGEVDAGPWLRLVRKLWPEEAGEILDWFAHRVQRPGEKVNHALVLGGAPGIGKDTVLEGVRRAVGIGNCHEIMPTDMKGGFNDHVKSVMLVINELRDDATMSQYAFYEKSKTLIAAPPYTATINSKYLKQYLVPNVVGVVMTTNYRVMGLYLPPDDRRHLVCWSDAPAIAEGDTALKAVWHWMEGGGFAHVAAWLRARDISHFDPKAPPRKTDAFLDIVAASGSVEEWALQDRIEKLGKPKVLRIKDLRGGAFDDEKGAPNENAQELEDFLREPKYRKVLAEALGRAGYRKIVNKGRRDGRWKIRGVDETVYGRADVDAKELVGLASKLDRAEEQKPGNA